MAAAPNTYGIEKLRTKDVSFQLVLTEDVNHSHTN